MGRTPRTLAALAITTFVVACADQPDAIPGGGPLCDAVPTAIGVIQGTGSRSPLEGQSVNVLGIVTRVTTSGFVIESPTPDADPASSEGLFLSTPGAMALEPGMQVAAQGVVTELGDGGDTQTALDGVQSLTLCGEHQALPLTHTRLPMAADTRESLENMRVTLDSASIATDVYRLRDGEIRIAAGGMLASPTEVAWPGNDARRQRQQNQAAWLKAQLVDGDRTAFPGGTELVSDEGVLGHDGKSPKLFLEAPANLARPLMPSPPAPAAESLRVLSLNLYNYFNGDGQGGGFPAPRGASSEKDFERQRERLRAALEALRPDIVAVMELENDGFAPGSAAADLLDDMAQATGASWEAANPGVNGIGSDEITVGLFHRPDRVRAMGPALTLGAAPFDLLSRKPVARAFAPVGGGPAFFVAVNHFKSKGSCPDHGPDRDLGDGQGCWNAARTAAAKAVGEWVLQLAAAQADGRALIVGDLNAYRLEDPVRHLVGNGFEDLTGGGELGHEYSYVFYGEAGTLDYALATPALRRLVAQARILHINAAWPPGMKLPAPWLRSSDHDPVIVDLRFRQSFTAR